MLYLPPVHRLIVPVLLVLLIITIYKSRQQLHFLSDFPSLEIPSQPQPAKGSVIQASTLPHHQLLRVNASSGPHGVPKAGLLGFEAVRNLNPPNNTRFSRFNQPILNPHLHALFRCPITPNPRTKHIRLASILRNITVAFPSPDHPDDRQYWNPTVMALPYWSKNQYLIAARVLTAGTVQLNTLCEANICYGRESDKREWQEPCTPEDVELLGPAGGLRCVSEPQVMQVPPTPALRCEGVHNFFADIPGFQDPRIFWSGRGEPLMLVHSGSRYGCLGMWLIDLRSVHTGLEKILASSPRAPSLGPLISYKSLTELTRNPANARSSIEKNWMLFFPGQDSFVQYEISPRGGRSLAKLLGNGVVTTNMTDPTEESCFLASDESLAKEKLLGGGWHQATNSLKLILCNRGDEACTANADNSVFFAIIHRKRINSYRLPLRYERYVMVWSAAPPYGMLGLSQYPLLLANETANGYSAEDNWADDEVASKENRGLFAKFTYTGSISWAWRKDEEVGALNTGYLDDDVLLGIGIDDVGRGFTLTKALGLIQCLRACPGRKAR